MSETEGPPAALHTVLSIGQALFTDPKEKTTESRRRAGFGEEEGTVENMPFPLVFLSPLHQAA